MVRNTLRLRACSKRQLALILTIMLLLQQHSVLAATRTIDTDTDIQSTNSSSDDKKDCLRAQVTTAASLEIDELTKQILRKEVSLERLNTLFRQQTTLTSPWRQRRMFAYGEGNASLTEAGLLLALPSLYQISDQRDRPGTKKKPGATPSQLNNLRAATRLYLIANAYGAGGDVVELGLNFKNYCALRKRGLNPSSYRKRVHNLRVEIDGLLEQRRKALMTAANVSPQDRFIAEAEGKLLNDLRDLYLLEYTDYHASCKRFWYVQIGAYLTDFVKNATGGVGNIIGLEAYHLHRPLLFGGEGLMTLISGVIILIVPLVGRVTGNMSGLTDRRLVSQEAADVRTSNMETYSSNLHDFLALSGDSFNRTDYVMAALSRRQLYEDQERIMKMRTDFLKKEQKDAHNTLVENIIFGGIVGSTKVSNGALTMIAGWRYANEIPTNVRLYAAGTTAYTAGSGFSMLETARLATEYEWSNWKLRNSDLLPSNQFKRRLHLLDSMDGFLSK